MRNEIKKIIDRVYTFFKQVMIGLPAQTVYMQARWRAALVNFLQAYRVTIPPF